MDALIQLRLVEADILEFLATCSADDDKEEAFVRALQCFDRAYCDGPPDYYSAVLEGAQRLIDRLVDQSPRLRSGGSYKQYEERMRELHEDLFTLLSDRQTRHPGVLWRRIGFTSHEQETTVRFVDFDGKKSFSATRKN